jgi:cytochrome c biogenesis protein CcmG, thiol:disulfide interchange protein DsbE
MRHATWLALVTTLACGGSVPPPPSAPSPLLSAEAPDIERQTLRGERISMAELRGTPVLVEFFAEHCKPCMEALPALEQLRTTSPHIAIIAISEDEQEGTAVALASQLGLGFSIIHDRGHVLAGRYRVSDLPATFVVDARGRVRWKGVRAYQTQELLGVVDSLK